MEYQQIRLKIAKEVGNRSGEGLAYGNDLGMLIESIGNF